MKSVFVIGPVNKFMIKSVKHEQMPNFLAIANSPNSLRYLKYVHYCSTFQKMQCLCNFLTYGDVLTHYTIEPFLSGHLGDRKK